MTDMEKYSKYIAPEQRVDDKITGEILFEAIYNDIRFGDDSRKYISAYINYRFDKITDISSQEMRTSYINFLWDLINYKAFIPYHYISSREINMGVFFNKYDVMISYIKKLHAIFINFDIDIRIDEINDKFNAFILSRN